MGIILFYFNFILFLTGEPGLRRRERKKKIIENSAFFQLFFSFFSAFFQLFSEITKLKEKPSVFPSTNHPTSPFTRSRRGSSSSGLGGMRRMARQLRYQARTWTWIPARLTRRNSESSCQTQFWLSHLIRSTFIMKLQMY
jgi:hypothetical protein